MRGVCILLDFITISVAFKTFSRRFSIETQPFFSLKNNRFSIENQLIFALKNSVSQ